MKDNQYNFRVRTDLLIEAKAMASSLGLTMSQFIVKAIEDKMYDLATPMQDGKVPLSAMEEISRQANVQEGFNEFNNKPRMVLAAHEYAERLRTCNAIAMRYVGWKAPPNYKREFGVAVSQGAMRIMMTGAMAKKWYFRDTAYAKLDRGILTVTFDNTDGLPVPVLMTPGLVTVILQDRSEEMNPHHPVPRQTIAYDEMTDGFSVPMGVLAAHAINISCFMASEEF